MMLRARKYWPTVQFKEIVAHSAFGPRFSGELYSEAGNVATLRTTDLSPSGEISYSTMPFAEINENKFANHFLRISDLVISRSGRIGTTAVFKGFDIPVLPGAFLFVLGSATTHCQNSIGIFNSPAGQALIRSVARGVAQQNINISNVKLLNVPHPVMREQEKVVEILAAYDDLIENNRQRIALLEEAARLLYREWFVHFRFPGHEHVKITDGIPDGWERRAFDDVCKAIGGGTPKTSKSEYWSDGDIPWYTPTDVTRNSCLPLLDSATKITETGLRGLVSKDASAWYGSNDQSGVGRLLRHN